MFRSVSRILALAAVPAILAAPTLASDTVPTEKADMLLAGMMTYQADAPLIELCKEGQRAPIAPEGEYPALERAYLTDQSAPGAPLYVMVDGEIAPRPGADGGSDRDTLVVDRFIRTRPGITCERQMADAELVNTYWRLDSLEGEPFPKGVGKKEAHILLETGDDGAYRATVGCNSVRGSYTLDGDMLAFGGGAMTMMACPDPLDRLERQLTAMLGEVTGFDTEGETLVLRDAGGNPRAIFTAIYF